MQIPEQVDVIIVGAGPGGWPAAVGAARAGAKVLLIEEDDYPGGAPVDNFVSMPCGRYITGVYAELINRLEQKHRLPVEPAGPIPKLWSRWFLPSAFAIEIEQILAAEPNIFFLSGVRIRTPLVESVGGEQRAVGVVLPLAEGELHVHTHVLIDATGSGAIAEAAGATAMYGTESRDTFDEPMAPEHNQKLVQQCTMMYISQRMGDHTFDFAAHGLNPGVDPEFGWLKRDYKVGLERSCGIYLTWGTVVRCPDTREDFALSEARRESMQQLKPHIEHLHANGHTVHLAPRLGVREVRRIVGEELIAEPWIRQSRMPDDTVAIGNWHLDNWGGSIKPEDREVPPYGVPLRCLMPKGTTHLLMACKAISISHLAFSSYRVQPTIASASQAAGVCAAFAARRGLDVRDIPFADIRSELEGPRHNYDVLPS